MPLISRRNFLALSGAVASTVGLANTSVASSTEDAEDWPMFGYDTTNTAAISDRQAPEKLAEIWSLETQFEVDSSPVVADGMVYIGSDDRHLYAIDMETGEVEWSVTTANEVSRSTPAVKNGVVYFHAMSEALYAFDAHTGDEIWAAESQWPGSSVTVKDNTVYYGHHQTVFARETDTSDIEWEFSADGRILGAPAVVENTVYVGTTDNTLHAVNTGTGEQEWQFDTYGSIWSSPAVSNDTVFVGSDDSHVYAINAEDGSERWRLETEGTSVRASPAIDNEHVYVLGSQQLYAIDLSDGSIVWTFDELHALNSSPAIADDVLYVGGGGDGIVYAIRTDTGEPISTFQTGDAIWNSSPAIASEKVFIGSHDHSLYALGNDQTFKIRNFDSPEEVTETDEIVVTATIENTGIREGEQDVVFTIDSNRDDVASAATLGSNETFDATFTYATDSSDPPTVTVTVTTDDDEMSADVIVSTDEEGDGDAVAEDDTDTPNGTDLESSEDSDEEIAGFGIGSALAGVGGAVYFLQQRLVADNRED